MFVSSTEARAHCAILGAITARREWSIDQYVALRRMQPALLAFAPRCPACRSVLESKRLDGMTKFRCGCGHGFSEVA